MAGSKETRRQKDISRLKREQLKCIQPDRRVLKKTREEGYFHAEDLSAKVKKEMENHGLKVHEALRQLELLKCGVPFVKLVRPARINDGIVSIEEREFPRLIALHEEEMRKGRMLKFVPASGAATRMFQDWYDLLQHKKNVSFYWEDFVHYPFYLQIQAISRERGWDIEDPERRKDRLGDVLEFLLSDGGLNYGQLPKALIPFHRYPDETRTAIEEHLVEAAMYVCDGEGRARLHITVQPAHEELVRSFLLDRRYLYEKRYGVTYEITISSQSPETDTIALDNRGRLLRDEEGKIVFRPGGHGALLKNLNDLRGDIVFVKNIDNVTREEHISHLVIWHKIMGGFLIDREREIHELLRELAAGKWEKAYAFVQEELQLKMPEAFRQQKEEEKIDYLYDLLHRPIRVCGMVKNEGEPGGGPFWVQMPQGEISLQIIEEIQVNRKAEKQLRLWQEATHFNPVDMVLSLRDEEGQNYNLHLFAEASMSIVTHKTYRGKPIRVVEHPGLWNGGMARWITFFVEIPLTTFNPVKTCADLLRPAHQPDG